MEKKIKRNMFDKYILPIYKPANFIPIKGKGSKIWDQNGIEYIDLSSGIAVNGLGHCHPKLIKTLKKQSEKLWHTSNIFTNEPSIKLAKEIIKNTFADKVFFSNSGSEANELAFKLARYYSNKVYNSYKTQIISFYNSFHGRTLFTVSVGGKNKYSNGFGPKPSDIIHVPFNDLNAVKSIINNQTCAIVVEPIQGEGGIIPAKKNFLIGIKKLCEKYNALLIMDEIQCGMGRTGKLFAYMHYKVIPDILTTAKAIGGGFPISATLTTEKISKIVSIGCHGSTYGGNPLACSVAKTSFKLINSPTILNGIKIRNIYIINKLNNINEKYKIFKEIRGIGLLIGAELNKKYKNNLEDFINYSYLEKVIIVNAGSNVIRFIPSLIINIKDIQEGLNRFEKAIVRTIKNLNIK